MMKRAEMKRMPVETVKLACWCLEGWRSKLGVCRLDARCPVVRIQCSMLGVCGMAWHCPEFGVRNLRYELWVRRIRQATVEWAWGGEGYGCCMSLPIRPQRYCDSASLDTGAALTRKENILAQVLLKEMLFILIQSASLNNSIKIHLPSRKTLIMLSIGTLGLS